MDPRLIYTDFLMYNSELLLQPTTDAGTTFKDDRGYTYCALTVFRSDDPDLARDPLSTNRRLRDSADLEMFGTMIVAGPTPDQVFVLIPDSVGPTVDPDSPADIQHVVGLSLGSAADLTSTLPPEGLHLEFERPHCRCVICHVICVLPTQSASASGGVQCPAALCGLLLN